MMGPLSLSTIHNERSMLNIKHVKLKSLKTVSSVNYKDVSLQSKASNCDILGNRVLNSDIQINGGSSSHNSVNSCVETCNNKCPEKKNYVLQSVKRLAFFNSDIKHLNELNKNNCHNIFILDNFEAKLEIMFERQFNKFQPKRMRSSPKERVKDQIKSTSSDDGIDESSNKIFSCKWFDCSQKYVTVEKFIKHVKKEHIQPFSKNDVFVCLWRDCRYSNQPSCSFKWLSKHVLEHCGVKPFRCVIHGCDMGFTTQNGLARHVPTHFNEGNVRRTCVKTNTLESAQHWHCSKIKNNLKLNVTTDLSECSKDSFDDKPPANDQNRFKTFVDSHRTRSSATIKLTDSQAYHNVKTVLDQSTCSAINNNGYKGNSLRIDHQVICKRTLPGDASGENEILLAPSLKRIFPHTSTWFSNILDKKNSIYVDLPMHSIEASVKNRIHDLESVSRRRRRKRK